MRISLQILKIPKKQKKTFQLLRSENGNNLSPTVHSFDLWLSSKNMKRIPHQTSQYGVYIWNRIWYYHVMCIFKYFDWCVYIFFIVHYWWRIEEWTSTAFWRNSWYKCNSLALQRALWANTIIMWLKVVYCFINNNNLTYHEPFFFNEQIITFTNCLILQTPIIPIS